jgi:hypothetical protein
MVDLKKKFKDSERRKEEVFEQEKQMRNERFSFDLFQKKIKTIVTLE